MMPEEWASMRSMARCVLPVLVGPRTAVTPAPRARASRATGEEKEMGISCPEGGFVVFEGPYPPLLYHNATGDGARLEQENESGTNRGRISDSPAVGVRSRRYVGAPPPRATISGIEAGGRTPIRHSSVNESIKPGLLGSLRLEIGC